LGLNKRQLLRFEQAQEEGKDLSIELFARYLEALGGDLEFRIEVDGEQVRWAAAPQASKLSRLPWLALLELSPLSRRASSPAAIAPEILIPRRRKAPGAEAPARLSSRAAPDLHASTTTSLEVLQFVEGRGYRLSWEAVFKNDTRVPLAGGSQGTGVYYPDDLARQLGLSPSKLDAALNFSPGSWRQLARRALAGEGVRVDNLKRMVAGLGGRLEAVAFTEHQRHVLDVGALPTPEPLELRPQTNA
jgi:hypothetical protein